MLERAAEHGIVVRRDMTPGEVDLLIQGAAEAEKRVWRRTAWQTAWLLNALVGTKKKVWKVEDLLGMDEDGGGAMPKPGTPAHDRFKRDFERRVSAYMARCRAANDRRKRTEGIDATNGRTRGEAWA